MRLHAISSSANTCISSESCAPDILPVADVGNSRVSLACLKSKIKQEVHACWFLSLDLCVSVCVGDCVSVAECVHTYCFNAVFTSWSF